MMKMFRKKFKILNNVLDISGLVCQFPYSGENVSMTIILPNESVKLEVVEKELSVAKLKEILEIQVEREEVNVSIPKFKLEFEEEVYLLFNVIIQQEISIFVYIFINVISYPVISKS